MAAVPGAPGALATTCHVTNPKQPGLLTAWQLGPRAASHGDKAAVSGSFLSQSLRATGVQGEGTRAILPDEEGSGRARGVAVGLGKCRRDARKKEGPRHATRKQEPCDVSQMSSICI